MERETLSSRTMKNMADGQVAPDNKGLIYNVEHGVVESLNDTVTKMVPSL